MKIDKIVGLFEKFQAVLTSWSNSILFHHCNTLYDPVSFSQE